MERPLRTWAELDFVSRKLSTKTASVPEQKKARTASTGRTTGGSPGRLNEVFTRMGAGSCSPKRASNSHSKRFVGLFDDMQAHQTAGKLQSAG